MRVVGVQKGWRESVGLMTWGPGTCEHCEQGCTLKSGGGGGIAWLLNDGCKCTGLSDGVGAAASGAPSSPFSLCIGGSII